MTTYARARCSICSITAIVLFCLLSSPLAAVSTRSGLAGLGDDGSIWYTADLSHWNRVPGYLASMVTGDLNGDGSDDIVGLGADGSIWYTLDLSHWTRIPGSLARIHTGDLNGDGNDDIVGTGSDNTIWYTLDRNHWTCIPGQLPDVITGDWDGDSHDEIAGVGQHDSVLWFTTDLVNWSRGPDRPWAQRLASGGFSGEGKSGILGIWGGTVLYTADRTRTAEVRYISGTYSGAGVFAGDFNGDGQCDIAALGPATAIWYTLDIGDHWNQIPGSLPGLVVGDFNGDWQDDLAGLDIDGSIWYTADKLRWSRVPGWLSSLYSFGLNRHRFYGLCYGPCSGDENPETGPYPTSADMSGDLGNLRSYTRRVRVYSFQGFMQGFSALPAAQGIDCLGGCWISSDVGQNSGELQALIDETELGHLDRGIVGNEVIQRGDLTSGALITLMQSFKTATGLPVSTADTWSTWLAHPELAAASDFIVVHIYAYWDGVSIENAAQYVIDKCDAVKAAYPGKDVIIGETGWPSGGPTVGSAVPSVANQRRFINEFTRLADQRGIKYYYFEAFREPWKTTQEGGVGDRWGLPFLRRKERTLPITQFPFTVYDEYTATGQHFVPSLWQGDATRVTLDPQCTVQPHSGQYCTRITYNPQRNSDWTTVAWLNPESGGGDRPGYTFLGVSRLTFWARGNLGGEVGYFGVGTYDDSKPYVDSLRTRMDGFGLTSSWRKYYTDIPGAPANIESVISGFYWQVYSSDTPPAGTIYIDDIQFE